MFVLHLSAVDVFVKHGHCWWMQIDDRVLMCLDGAGTLLPFQRHRMRMQTCSMFVASMARPSCASEMAAGDQIRERVLRFTDSSLLAVLPRRNMVSNSRAPEEAIVVCKVCTCLQGLSSASFNTCATLLWVQDRAC